MFAILPEAVTFLLMAGCAKQARRDQLQKRIARHKAARPATVTSTVGLGSSESLGAVMDTLLAI